MADDDASANLLTIKLTNIKTGFDAASKKADDAQKALDAAKAKIDAANAKIADIDNNVGYGRGDTAKKNNDLDAARKSLVAAEAEYGKAHTEQLALQNSVNNATKLPTSMMDAKTQNVMDTRTFARIGNDSVRVAVASASASSADAKATADISRVHAQLDALERKMDKEDTGTYLRDKLTKLVNSQVGCEMVNRCSVKQPVPIDPKKLDEIFPASDAGKVRGESYWHQRNKAVPTSN